MGDLYHQSVIKITIYFRYPTEIVVKKETEREGGFFNAELTTLNERKLRLNGDLFWPSLRSLPPSPFVKNTSIY